MGFTAFIDVAIGLMVVYLAAGLTATVFNEWLSQTRAWPAASGRPAKDTKPAG